ncbi:hypothetical protein GL270_21725 [Aeromonas veronii]|uniref:hypothetical protein n=1 Tax=Aeromonas veronii TaxID=654 RepID=UPI001C5AB9A6|nr:hypothetical protein [Aeromonas veronii]MBW3783815.1 hypothetical protein [Aeromonas veronii]MBW3783817.1 hypothetical protein [Aeromonas veronii]
MFQPITDPTQFPAYLGDGVYASFDGYQMWLRTEGMDGVNEIAIDDQTWAALVAYRNRLTATFQESQA